MEIIVTINSCKDCRHLDHSGAFTPGGAKSICGHNKAVDTMTKESKFINEEDRHHWRHRQIDIKTIPENCPLKNGGKY